jgi:hypothetical protein
LQKLPEDDPTIIMCGLVLHSMPLSRPGGSGPGRTVTASPLQLPLTRPGMSVPGAVLCLLRRALGVDRLPCSHPSAVTSTSSTVVAWWLLNIRRPLLW